MVNKQLLADMFTFHADLVFYALGMLGLHWETSNVLPGARCFFHPSHGDVILRYRNCFDEQFRKRIRTVPLKVLLDYGGISRFAAAFGKDNFIGCSREEIPERFFVYSAFLVDLCVFCCRYDQQVLIDSATLALLSVFQLFGLSVDVDEVKFWFGLQKVIDAETLVSGRQLYDIVKPHEDEKSIVKEEQDDSEPSAYTLL